MESLNKISYETKEDNDLTGLARGEKRYICITPCPYPAAMEGQSILSSSSSIAYVGSGACAKCKYSIKIDTELKKVSCCFENDS
jgi:hypothetical protein